MTLIAEPLDAADGGTDAINRAGNGLRISVDENAIPKRVFRDRRIGIDKSHDENSGKRPFGRRGGEADHVVGCDKANKARQSTAARRSSIRDEKWMMPKGYTRR